MTDTFADRLAAVQDAIANGTFDPVGANWPTFGFGSTIGSPSILTAGSRSIASPPTVMNAPPAGSNQVPGLGIAATIANDLTATQGGTVSPPSSGAGAETVSAAPGILSGAADWAMRAIVIVLGFIFIAAGLRMFGRGAS